MRKTGFLLLMITLLFATSCDFLRKIAGRPTSFELEERRLDILRIEEAEQQARLDSLKRVQKMMLDSIARLDSLAVLDSIRQVGGSVLNPSSLGGLFSTKLEARYYVIVGAFRSRENAERMHKKVEGKGYSPALISFRNGMNAVGICPSNNIQDAHKALRELKKEKFCPSGAWILLND